MNCSRYLTTLSAATACLACGGYSQPTSSFRLELSGSFQSTTEADKPGISITAGDTLLLGLLVIGTAPADVTFTSADLPQFVTLNGAMLRIASTRRDSGHFTFTVTATAGHESESLLIDLLVKPYNHPPHWLAPWIQGCPNPPSCTVSGTPVFGTGVDDADADAVTVDVEVVRHGDPFKGVPTYSGFLAAGWGSEAMTIPFPGLQAQVSYDYAVRIRDEFGAFPTQTWQTPAPDANGWMHQPSWGFYLGP